MGSHAAVPGDDNHDDGTGESTSDLGDLLSGRLSEVDVDSVEAVRAIRESE